MEKFDGGMILAWLVLSFIFTILTMALFLFLSPPLQYGGCSFVYSNNDEIAFTGFDPLGNIYLVIFTDSTFDEVNSTYPYVTTLHPIPANATSRIYAVAKFSADMSLLWARIIGAPQGEFVWFRSFAITQDGGLVMYGTGTDIFTSMPEKDLGYVLKLDNEGELNFVHTWPHLDENLGIRSFDDTGEFITVPYHLPDTGNANYLETSGNENTIAKVSAQGLEWTSYLHNETIIHDIKSNGTTVALIVERDRLVSPGIFSKEWSFITLDAATGKFTSVIPLQIPETIATDDVKLTTRDNRFLIFMPSFNYSTVTILDPVLNNSSDHPLFPHPFFDSQVLVSEKNEFLIAYTVTGTDTRMPFGEEVPELSWNGDRNRLSLIALDSSGKEVRRLRIEGNFGIISMPVDFRDGKFLIATPMGVKPFELTGGFQTDPLGSSDPFVAVIGEDKQVGTFYGNSGNPVMLCY